jgi:putative aldouronate transport system permease protein
MSTQLTAEIKPKLRVKWTSAKMTLLLMTVPSFLVVLVFSYGPLFGWIYAFFDYRIGMKLSQAEFRGFYFFKIAFSDPDLFRVLLNTLVISFCSLLSLPLACAFAIFLTEMKGKFYKKFIQIASILPFFISWVIVFSLAFSMFAPESGLVNRVLLGLGWIDSPFDPIANNRIAWFFQAGLVIWKGLGYSAIIFFATIASISKELYEAAEMDGAGRFMRIWHITIPGLVPTITTLLLISIGAILSNGFEQYYVFMNAMVRSKIEVLDYYVYRIGLAQNDVPVATAFGISKTIVSVVLLFSANLLSKKVRDQSIL